MFQLVFKNIIIRFLVGVSLVASTYLSSKYLGDIDLIKFYTIQPFVNFFSISVLAPILTCHINHCIRDNVAPYDKIQSVIGFHFYVSLFVSLAYIGISILGNTLSFSDYSIAFYLYLELFLGGTIGYYSSSYGYSGKHDESTKAQVIIALTTIVLPISVVSFYGMGISAWFFGLSVARIIQVFLFNELLFIMLKKSNYKLEALSLLFSGRKKDIIIMSGSMICVWIMANSFRIGVLTLPNIDMKVVAMVTFLSAMSMSSFSVYDTILRSYSERFISIAALSKKTIKLDEYRNIIYAYLFGAFVIVIVGPFILKYLTINRFAGNYQLLVFFVVYEFFRNFVNLVINVNMAGTQRNAYYKFVYLYYFVAILYLFISIPQLINQIKLSLLLLFQVPLVLFAILLIFFLMYKQSTVREGMPNSW